MKKITSTTSPNKITYKESPMIAKFGPQEVIMSTNSIKNYQPNDSNQKNTLFSSWKTKTKNQPQKVSLLQKNIAQSIKSKKQNINKKAGAAKQDQNVRIKTNENEEIDYEHLAHIVSRENNDQIIKKEQNHQGRQQLEYEEKRLQGNSNLEERQYTFFNGDVYIGTWNGNKIQGYGVYTFSKQNMQYRGQFKKGLQHGTGVLLRKPANSQLKQEEIYDGQWMNGQKHGLGKYYYFKDTFYDGNWIRNKKQGYGTFKSPEGEYTGQWRNDVKSGKGILKLKNGNIFEGRWQSDNFVQGRMLHSNGDSYQGELIDSKRHGHGVYSYANKTTFKGYWEYNAKTKGEMIFFNGDIYNGQLDDNKFSGKDCKYRWNSGQQFYGEFSNDRPINGKYRSPSQGQFQYSIR